MRPRLAPLVLLFGLAAATVPGYGAWRAATGPDGGWWAAAFVVDGMAVLLGTGLAALVLARAAGRSGAGWLALFLAAFPASFALTGRYLAGGTLLDGLVEAGSLAMSGLGAIALAGFTARFPRQLSPADVERESRGWARTLRRLVVRPRRFFVASVMAMTGWIALPLFEGPEPLHGLAALLTVATATGIFGLVLGAFATLRLGYRLADPDQRVGLIWVLEGILLVVFSLLALVATGFYDGLRDAVGVRLLEIPFGLQSLVASAFLLGGLVCLSLAILHHGTLDPRLVLRRTTVYGLLGLLLTAAFAAVEAVAESLFTDLTGAASAATSAAIALAFAPFLRRMDRWMEARLGDGPSPRRREAAGEIGGLGAAPGSGPPAHGALFREGDEG